STGPRSGPTADRSRSARFPPGARSSRSRSAASRPGCAHRARRVVSDPIGSHCSLECSEPEQPSPGISGSIVTPAEADRLRMTLAAVAPGTALRDGLERILRGNTGGIVVLGFDRDIEAICSGGFPMDVEFTATKLR